MPLKTYKNVLKRVALSVLTPRRRRQQQKRRRHNEDIHDEDVENQQHSPHPMPPIILPQVFLYAPNTFKPVSQISAMTNTSSTLLNSKNVFYSMRSCPKTQALSLKVFFIIIILFPYIVPKPKLYLYTFFNIIFPYIVPKPKLYLYTFFNIIFPYIVPKPKLYLYKVFTIIFPYIITKPEQGRASQLILDSLTR